MSLVTFPMPPRMVDLKREIISGDAKLQARLVESWNDLLAALATQTQLIKEQGSNYIPQIDFSDIKNLKTEDVDKLKSRGCVVIRNVVDDAEAMSWKKDLVEFVQANPSVEGLPANDKQFFQLYWTKSQVRGRSHPNVLESTKWLNNMYHLKSMDKKYEGVDLSTPLSYADRFRIRRPGVQWDVHPPHIDGGGIERWEDQAFRAVYADILNGNWREHDPYALEGRIDAKTSLYGRPGQSSVFRTFQGWLALSETAPTQGTLKVFPDIILSNAYIILRPFFKLKATLVTADELEPQNWELDLTTPEFPGIMAAEKGFYGPRPTPALHPHLHLEETMTSVPKVYPGDMVFWHCDLIHSVEKEHTGTEDSAVMYIPAVPLTPQNISYIQKQAQSFLKGASPPDFPVTKGEDNFAGVANTGDILSPLGKTAMGLEVS